MRLKETWPDNRQRNSEIEKLMWIYCNKTVACNHQQTAKHQRSFESQYFICENTTDERKCIYKCLNSTIFQVCLFIRKKKFIDHENGQYTTHSVKTEPFPHFYQKQIP